MGLFDALGELAGGVIKTGGEAIKTGLHAIDLDPESTVDGVGDTLDSAVDTIADTLDSLFD